MTATRLDLAEEPAPIASLLPCAHCGSPDAFMFGPNCNKRTPYNQADRAFPVVRCRNCHAEVPGTNWDKSGQSAIAAWNRRAGAQE